MNASLQKVFGYQGDPMNLPVRDITMALPFYEDVLGFRVVSRTVTPHASAILARDRVQIGLAENGGDPTQDGCAFHVTDLEAWFAELRSRGFESDSPEFKREERGDGSWMVFYVVAPDGLCYWFGERQSS